MKHVVESFSRAAEAYRAHSGLQSAMAEWLADWIPADRSGRALEVGAGPGIFTRRLLPWKGRLTVSDFSTGMCAAGRAAFPDLDWRVMSAEAPARGPWDWIFSSSMLQWVAHPTEVFSAWKRQLSPKGRVLGSLFAGGSLPEWHSVTGAVSPVKWRSVEEWRSSLEIAGLEVVRDAVETRVFRHPSAQAFLRNLHVTGAAPERRLKAGALRKILHEYERKFGGPQGARATWVFYRFEAR